MLKMMEKKNNDEGDGLKSRVNVDSLLSAPTLIHISSNFSPVCPDTRKQSFCHKF